MAGKRLKVVQVLPALESGGVERGTLEVAEALVRAGHESIVISAGGRMVEDLERAGSRHVQWDLGKKSPLTLLQTLPLRRWLMRERPDIVHLRSRLPAWIVWLAWRTLDAEIRPRFVTTVHGLYSVSPYSAIMTKGERVIAVSKTVEDYIFKNYPDTEKARVRLIYRGVDPKEFPYGYQPPESWLNDWYHQYPQLKGKRILTLPGRLTRLKGHHDFIQLIHDLNRDGMEVYGLVVGGEDPRRLAYARELRAKVRQMGMSGHIIFTGNRSDIKEIYAVSDIVMSLSTKQESFGRTVLEALSIGKPVIGYDQGGVGEILAELFPFGSIKMNDATMLESVTRQSIKYLEEKPSENRNFLKQRMIDETLNLYCSLLSLVA